MVQASLRLVLLTALFLMLAVFAVVGVRWMGLKQEFRAPAHPWFERSFWGVYSPTAEELCQNPDLDLLPGKNWIVTVPLKRHEDDWTIPCAEPIRLGDFLKHTLHRDFLLNILAHDTWSLDKLVEITGAFDETKRFAVTTESQKIAMFLRKKAPQWLFAADGSSMLRLRTFESLWVESAMDFWPDFVIANFAASDPVQIDARMAAELERRKKRILWNWNENATQDPPVPIQGVMTNRPTAARQKWGDRL